MPRRTIVLALASLAILAALSWTAGRHLGAAQAGGEAGSPQEPPAAEAGTTEPAPHRARPNRLAGESSPYLLLHQYNPVDWYPWGEEALAKARAEDKPIFLSVGYSTCYWCHVMERESFSNPEVAALINRYFVPIKVDREERPDLDEIYMTATQLLTRHGGWPNSVFLTPQLKPFFAGTYFPPEDRDGRPGFKTLLRALHDAWVERRADVDKQADALTDALRQVLEERDRPAAAPPPAAVVKAARDDLERRFDATWGGFGTAPKFPTPSNLLLLLALAEDGDEGARTMLATTLDRMARGGIFDQLGGGFHRYSTDRRWLVPHFEKMLYDNGHLLEVYARWYALADDPQAARVVRRTAAFLRREMSSPEGAFLSAIDAETNAREGAFYVWTEMELRAVLGERDFAFLAPIYGFDGEPTFEQHEYVLHLPQPLARVAAQQGLDEAALVERLEPLRRRLLARRDQRPRPLTDDKVLADWNGMAIAGMAAAGRLLEDRSMVDDAARAARFVLANLRPQGRPLQHAWRGGKAKIDAYLDDYAFLVRGLLALHRATGDKAWLERAVSLTEEQIARLRHPDGGFVTAAARPDVLFQLRPLHDGAVPSANAVATLNLLALAERTGEARWRDQAEAALKAFAPQVEQAPAAYQTLALAVARYHGPAAAAQRRAALPHPAPGSPEAEAAGLVTATAQLGDPGDGGWRPLKVRLSVAPGWHVNANPASDDFLIPTTVEATAGELRALRYPPAKRLELAFAERPVAVWDGTVEIAGEMRPAESARLLLTYQACDDQRCLPPIQRELTIGTSPAE